MGIFCARCERAREERAVYRFDEDPAAFQLRAGRASGLQMDANCLTLTAVLATFPCCRDADQAVFEAGQY